MAYANKLPEEKFTSIIQKIYFNARKEHEAAFNAQLFKAKGRSRQARVKQCSGRYEGTWQRLAERWTNQEVSNLFVIECLKNNRVIDDYHGVSFTRC
ncbi:hypothetical protein AB4254_11110 [Vibrio breoganii]